MHHTNNGLSTVNNYADLNRLTVQIRGESLMADVAHPLKIGGNVYKTMILQKFYL